MNAPDQFMIYHLHEWDTEKLKWKKKPVGLQGEALMVGAGIPTSIDRAYVAAQCQQLGSQYRVGLWLAPESNFFFIDLDDDAVDVNGNLTPLAAQIAAPFIHAGCYFEPSSSGRGAHVIGRYSAALPEHANSRKRVHPHEFYTRDRGCVLTTGSWHGDWNVDASVMLPAMLAEYFPPRIASETLVALGVGPRAEWRGPADDGDLVRRMLSASGSAAARMQGKVSLAKLWAGECEHDSESDLALAAHLAFWTGADVDRIERLMLLSGLKRDKWFEGRRDSSWLRQTIMMACATTRTVYAEPQRVDTAAALLGLSAPPVQPLANLSIDSDGVIDGAVTATQDWHELHDKVVAQINNAGTFRELHDTIMPTLGGYGWPPTHGNRIVKVLNSRLDIFNASMPIAQLRALVMPPITAEAVMLQSVKPAWAMPLIYVLGKDEFYDTITGCTYSHEALRMEFARFMPMKQGGTREDPVQRLKEHWEVPTVQAMEYRPDQGAIFEYGGKRLGNLFLASTMPTPAAPSEECLACIELFKMHIFEFVGRRETIFFYLLSWLAHNVQKPGRKIRWSPLLVGAQGDGKSIIGELMFAVMGIANVKMTSPSTLSNSGGFTDWATGVALNFMEEVKLEGKERRALYNAMKIFIGDSFIDLNRKGKASGGTLVNVTNHWANSNHRGAIPIEPGDRRWLVVYAPWESADGAALMKGLPGAEALSKFFGRLGASIRMEPGGWRSWLMNCDLSSFNPDDRAPLTEEREAMRSGSGDYLEQTIEDVIARGYPGVCIEVFCSSSLMGKVSVDMGSQPDGRVWNRILNDLGYQQHPKTVYWNGRTRRVWSKSSMTNNQIRDRLDKTSQPAPLL